MSKDESLNHHDGEAPSALHPTCRPLTPANLSHLQVLLSGRWLQMVPMQAEAHPTLRRMAHALDDLSEAATSQRANVRPSHGGISAGLRARRG